MSFKVGIALGGGAARGLAHLGVLLALEEAQIPVHILTGSSMGGVIGAVYASHRSAGEAIDLIRDYLHSQDFDQARLEFIHKSEKQEPTTYHKMKKAVKKGFFLAVSNTRPSFITEETLRGNLHHIIPDITFEQCRVKLALSAMDLVTAEEVTFESGPLLKRVMASCAIPGIFPPIEINQRVLVDGSWCNPVPVALAKRLGADLVIAVDVSPRMSKDQGERTGWDVSLRAAEGSRDTLRRANLKLADQVISVDVMDVHWADFQQLDRCLTEGLKAARQNLEEIKKKIFWKKLKRSLTFS